MTLFAARVKSFILKLISAISFSNFAIPFFTATSLIGIVEILLSKISEIVSILSKKDTCCFSNQRSFSNLYISD